MTWTACKIRRSNVATSGVQKSWPSGRPQGSRNQCDPPDDWPSTGWCTIRMTVKKCYLNGTPFSGPLKWTMYEKTYAKHEPATWQPYENDVTCAQNIAEVPITSMKVACPSMLNSGKGSSLKTRKKNGRKMSWKSGMLKKHGLALWELIAVWTRH